MALAVIFAVFYHCLVIVNSTIYFEEGYEDYYLWWFLQIQEWQTLLPNRRSYENE